ncbi:hypothetical protein L345_11994 [Ophiophagus hannah]|uniref:Reverse transcriptase domain-containing protein n=1 Tax=Ophiophagus hannah TaxID=8665 RepID=V8NJU9_OPHHA|nr:hypothetical protein L345_11994 [Ophiophagus hannah]
MVFAQCPKIHNKKVRKLWKAKEVGEGRSELWKSSKQMELYSSYGVSITFEYTNNLVYFQKFQPIDQKAGVLGEKQVGFRVSLEQYHGWLSDHLINNYMKHAHRKLYTAFVDFHTAFDSIDRNELLVEFGSKVINFGHDFIYKYSKFKLDIVPTLDRFFFPTKVRNRHLSVFMQTIYCVHPTIEYSLIDRLMQTIKSFG